MERITQCPGTCFLDRDASYGDFSVPIRPAVRTSRQSQNLLCLKLQPESELFIFYRLRLQPTLIYLIRLRFQPKVPNQTYSDSGFDLAGGSAVGVALWTKGWVKIIHYRYDIDSVIDSMLQNHPIQTVHMWMIGWLVSSRTPILKWIYPAVPEIQIDIDNVINSMLHNHPPFTSGWLADWSPSPVAHQFWSQSTQPFPRCR